LPGLLRRGAAAVLYVTQDYREAMAIADRIAVFLDGRLEQVASPTEDYESPASVAVARLFGDPTINLAEVTPVAEHGVLWAVIAGARARLGSAVGVVPDGFGI
jgi:multiple sugar transport system ATP-binding protein